MEIIFQLLNRIDVFLLVFARVLGIFIIAPLFAHRNIPSYTKIGFSLLFTIIIIPVLRISFLRIDSFYLLFLLSSKEFVTGMIMGFICYLFFSSVHVAGYLIDMQIGFSMASVIDPQDDTQVPLMGNFFYMIAILVFLSINGHHTFIYGLKNSFDIIPLGSLNMNMMMIDKLIGILIYIFIISFKMSAPIFVAIFISNVLLGILARTVPQMNVFVVGMPLKILLGLVIIFLVLPLYIGIYEHIFENMFNRFYDFLDIMRKG
ncbi:flagellar biosynthetic protein FliR [Clostridiaceae bacterium 35-E11]